MSLIQHFRLDLTEGANDQRAIARLKFALLPHDQGQLETFLVFDADKTLAAEDSGVLFWEELAKSQATSPGGEVYPLRELFEGPLSYSATAFQQAALLYEEAADDEQFDALCHSAASSVNMYPEFLALLRQAIEQKHVGVVIVTCGVVRIWENVLARKGLSGKVTIIGGGRISDGLIVTPSTKTTVVRSLRLEHNLRVWAFGDSPLDILMLGQADEAVVVVGEDQSRSVTMDDALANAMIDTGLQVRQTLLPASVRPRLNEEDLPVVSIGDPAFITEVMGKFTLDFRHATGENAARLLMTPMRDATINGPRLREAHRRAGWYLATEMVAEAVGVEEYSVPHVIFHDTTGYQLQDEERTCIVAIMRGGEPMALGVNDAFPSANLVHATSVSDVKVRHLEHQKTVILVDSVINSGASIIEMIKHVRSLHNKIRIVVVAGVVQAQAVEHNHEMAVLMRRRGVILVALRVSDNKYTGAGGSDTGNRLFNTTRLD